MPTHETKCVVCEEDCYCTNDTHALGCGEGCMRPPYIEFCSEECFLDLQKRMAAAWLNYQELKVNGSDY